MATKGTRSKAKFTIHDDNMLRSLVQQFGTRNWPLIAKNMNNRTERQCKERWENYLSPTINRTPWTPEQDAFLIQLHQSLGSKWVMLSKFFPGRTDAQVKNRFHNLSRQQATIGSSPVVSEPQSPIIDSKATIVLPTAVQDYTLSETSAALAADDFTMTPLSEDWGFDDSVFGLSFFD